MQASSTKPVGSPGAGGGDRRTGEPKPPAGRGFHAVLEEPGQGPDTVSPRPEPEPLRVPEIDGRGDRADGDEEPAPDRPGQSPDVHASRVPPVRVSFAAPAAAAAPPAAAEIQLLAESMLRTLRIGSDGRGGHEARLEVGHGPYAGARVRLVERAGRLRAELSGGGDLAALAERLRESLRARGLDLEDVELT